MRADRTEIQSSVPATEPLPKLRVGLVGTGPWAEEIHLPILCSHPNASFAGIWDRKTSKAKRLAEAVGARGFESYESMLESVDAVSFAVAPNAQPGLAKKAASYGRHVLLEKPLALSLPEGESLAAAITEAKVASVVMFTRRFEPKTASALAAVAEERTWLNANARFLSGAMRPGSPYAACEWRHRYGALWDVGPHVLSVLLPVLGDVATTAASTDERNTIQLRMTHINGAESEIAMSLFAEPEQQGESYVFRAGSHVSRLNVRLETKVRREAYAKALESLIASSKTGLPHACNPNFALSIVKILVAAETSLERGAPQSVRS
jgi:predicted dehydrogenase